jgi:hypothetical protein
MDNRQTFKIYTDYDINFARMQTREMARSSGFGTADQARISLAVSSLAQKLGLGVTRHGDVVLERLRDGSQRVGLRVIITLEHDADCDRILENIQHSKWMFMVDELMAEVHDPCIAQVTAIKWSTKERILAYDLPVSR